MSKATYCTIAISVPIGRQSKCPVHRVDRNRQSTFVSLSSASGALGWHGSRCDPNAIREVGSTEVFPHSLSVYFLCFTRTKFAAKTIRGSGCSSRSWIGHLSRLVLQWWSTARHSRCGCLKRCTSRRLAIRGWYVVMSFRFGGGVPGRLFPHSNPAQRCGGTPAIYAIELIRVTNNDYSLAGQASPQDHTCPACTKQTRCLRGAPCARGKTVFWRAVAYVVCTCGRKKCIPRRVLRPLVLGCTKGPCVLLFCGLSRLYPRWELYPVIPL